ncbi:succinate dehydrogenase subunit 4, mitochondrial-like [Dioscorea cayenensis subsp. rotundata]|uniref:Succinate dehydrogenase subunit 4, mitochondrial-like n=1 Tax=Dioscorea cayennensis subsp. rotundata TaxID=55577 RepID=A0AB40B1B5_DIOCR|nr:succinate dehydrogenase subunit 4, mitochondrial-like [Dioscorea cayenensis subsp. rotundata]
MAFEASTLSLPLAMVVSSILLILDRWLHDPSSCPILLDPFSSLANGTRFVPSSAAGSLGLMKVWNHGISNASHSYIPSYPSMQVSPRWFSMKASSDPDQSTEKNTSDTTLHQKTSKVVSFAPLEASASMKERPSALRSESLKIKRIELSQKITYALIPALLLVSKTKLTTSLIILSVFWQIHGFFKEIFLDYVHQEVTRKWVLIYFNLLLLIVAKDLFLAF